MTTNRKSDFDQISTRNDQHDRDIRVLMKGKSNKEKDLFTRADFIERLLIETANTKYKRRNSNASSSHRSDHIDKLLQDENNDWFFEKILEKFDHLRSKRTVHSPSFNDFDSAPTRGVERIIERRYYIKKDRPVPKRDQITSTGDLIETQQKYRQHSSASNVSQHHRSCSQCSSSTTPTFVEDFREQSDTLRHEITDLKNEIELLQKSQQEFFQKLQNHFQIKTSPTISQQFNPPSISPQRSPIETNSDLPVRLTTKSKSRSISTESQSSDEASTPKQSIIQEIKSPSSNTSTITQFTATKNPSISQAPIFNSTASSLTSNQANFAPKSLSTASTPITEFSTTKINQFSIPQTNLGSKSSSTTSIPITERSLTINQTSIPQAPSLNFKPQISPLHSKSSSPISVTPISKPSTPLYQDIVTSKPPPIPHTPSVESTILVSPVIVNPRPSSITSRTSSIAPAPIFGSELAHRRLLSPRSQIVSSSAYVLESLSESSSSSSTSSSGSNSPEPYPSRTRQSVKPSSSILLDSELKDLVHYSSQLEITGFPVSKPKFQPISSIPLDQYIAQVASTTLNRARQLDKYDLEIKPQENFIPSAPLLMPPLDISP